MARLMESGQLPFRFRPLLGRSGGLCSTMDADLLAPQSHYRLCVKSILGGAVSYFLHDTLLDRAFPLPRPPIGEDWTCNIDATDGLAILASASESHFACDFASEHVFVGDGADDLAVRKLGGGATMSLVELYSRPAHTMPICTIA